MAAARAKILVIEDDNDIREVLQELLMEEGHEVISALSFEEAIDLLRGGLYDLVILDHGLWGPHCDEELWPILPLGVPVIFCTAVYDLISHQLSDRPCGVIGKPIDTVALFRLIERLLAQAAAQQTATTQP